MKQTIYLTTTELAKILNISHVAVFKKIKKGQIKAEKIGRNYAIKQTELGGILKTELGAEEKLAIDASVKKTVKEYGGTLKLLGKI